MVDVLNLQAYGLAETGRMLRVPKSTLRRWLSRSAPKGKQHAPLLTPVDGRLTFQDLAELSVVQQLRAHGISASRIQNAAVRIREIKKVERPFLQGVLIDPNGLDLLVEVLGENGHRLVSTSKAPDQSLIREAVPTKLIQPERITIEDGAAVRVFPFSRDDPADDPQLVAIDPRHRFGRPVTSPSLIDIDGIVLRLSWGETFKDIAQNLRPVKGVAELEEGVRYWLSTMTLGKTRLVAASQHPRVEAFRTGETIASIARREKVREQTVVKHLGQVLETALAA